VQFQSTSSAYFQPAEHKGRRHACDSAYTTASGTSMAAPPIAGAMALLWSAIPSLRHQLTASRDALNTSAVHIASTQCGHAGPPNNPNADAHCHSDSQSHRIRRQKVHNSVDAISVIQVEGRSTLGTEGSLISGTGSELVSLRLGPFQPQPLLSNEKEICVSLCPP
jgi:subtilisin family serine protease